MTMLSAALSLLIAIPTLPAPSDPPAAAPQPADAAPETTPPAEPAPPVGQWHPLTFEGKEGRVHEARLWSPEPEKANGVGVLLIGGGAATDMHWTIPGFVPTVEGRPDRQTTLDGQPTRDADTIAQALVERGFAVLQWSMIHRDDPAYRENPIRAAGVEYPDSVDLTRSALRLLREQPGIDPNRIALVGHSLGATRACHVADDGVVAIVCLSGANLSKIRGRPADLTERALRAANDADIERDDAIDADEFQLWAQRSDAPSLYRAGFIEMDRDHDGSLRGWELAAQTAIAALINGRTDVLETSDQLRPGLPWPSDVLLNSKRPALVLYGGLDAAAVHGPLLEREIAQRGATHITVQYLRGLGHQLSPELGLRFGPIDPAAVTRLATWLEKACAAAPEPEPASGADADGE